MPASPYPVPQSDLRLTILAWAAVITVSTAPDIVLHEWTGHVPVWLHYAKMGLLLVVILASSLQRSLRPLRGFFTAMFSIFGLMAVRSCINFSWPLLQSLFGNSVFDDRMQAEQTGKLAVTAGVLVVLMALGYQRRAFFFAPGALRTTIEPVRWLGFPKPDGWPFFGLLWGFNIAAVLAVLFFFQVRPDRSDGLGLVPVLPSILFYAALNALHEEMTYRAPMLATLEAVTGSRQALWMSAYFFGAAHYFGIPGGLPGGAASIFMGYLLGKAMLETRGLFWAWWIHGCSDIVIFAFLTLHLMARG